MDVQSFRWVRTRSKEVTNPEETLHACTSWQDAHRFQSVQCAGRARRIGIRQKNDLEQIRPIHGGIVRPGKR